MPGTLHVIWLRYVVPCESSGQQSLVQLRLYDQRPCRVAGGERCQELSGWPIGFSEKNNEAWRSFFRINRPCGCRASCSNSTNRHFFLNPDVTLAGICFLFSFDCKWSVLLLLMSFLHSSGSSLVLPCEINCKERKRCTHTVFNKSSSTKTYFKLPVVVQWLVLFLDRLFSLLSLRICSSEFNLAELLSSWHNNAVVLCKENNCVFFTQKKTQHFESPSLLFYS